ncbi:MAG: AvrPphF family type III effector [Planctomycetota bacterium]
MGLFGDIADGVGDLASDAVDVVEDGAEWVGDTASDAAGWVGDHWKDIAVIGAAVVIGTVVTVATGGAGAPLLVALAAGGVAGGAGGEVTRALLNGESVDIGNVLKAGAISGVITVGTLGLGKLATPVITKALSPSATRSIATQADNLPGAQGAAGGVDDAARTGAATTTDDATTAAAGGAFGDLDAATVAALEKYGLTPETKLYRVADPKYVDVPNGRVPGNPNSMALVEDPFAPPIENPLTAAIRAEHPEFQKIMIAPQRPARELGPTLNFSTRDPSAYAKPGFVKLELTVDDVLANGGRIYRDVGANLNNSYIVTVPETLPFRGITAPTGHAAEGLPLPAGTTAPGIAAAGGPNVEKVETFVRTALNGGASTGYKVTTHPPGSHGSSGSGGGGNGGGGGHSNVPQPPPTGEGFLGRIKGTADLD